MAPSPDRYQTSYVKWLIFYGKVTGIMIFTAAIIAALNFIVNPMSLYPTHIFPPAIVNGRINKIKLMRYAKPKPQSLIIGASNVFLIEPKYVTKSTGQLAMNASVESAMAEDYYAMIRFAVEQANLNLKTVFIGLDVGSFRNDISEDPRLLETPELRSYVGVSDLYAEFKALRLAFARTQTQLSVYTLEAACKGRVKTPSAHMDPDGYVQYDQFHHDRMSGIFDLNENLRQSVKLYSARYTGFSQLSMKRLGYLEQTLRYCREHDISVVLFTTPLHPYLRNLLPNYNRRLGELRAQVENLCARYNFPFFDYSNLDSFEGSSTHFYDGEHMDEGNARLLETKLFNDLKAYFTTAQVLNRVRTDR